MMNKKTGAWYKGAGICEFTIWAPKAGSIKISLATEEKTIALEQGEKGYWSATVPNINPGDLYYVIMNDNQQMPDPASHSQPEGVHGQSEVIDHHSFPWSDTQWKGIPLGDYIIYELHVGTFSEEGTFDGVISKIPHLKELGITAVELMPVAQFPGTRNWGYDGVFPYAVQNSYGGPEGLKRLVDALHKEGIAVILDVVYNHLGPEGNCLDCYGFYHTSKYGTPWGAAINFDDNHSDEVKNYVIQNVLMWLRDYHIDALRLDAIHACKDYSARHFLCDMSDQVAELRQATGRMHFLIGECDLNDPKYITPVNQGGYGLDAQWSDEFHHSMHVFVTGEKNGFLQDFGLLDHIRLAFSDSYVYANRYSAERERTVGALPVHNPYSQFVVFSQNHDQVGNRAMGDRLHTHISFETAKLLAGTVLVSPYIPLLFMGEEYASESPFQYFISHTDKELIEAVRKGRNGDNKDWPDPQAESTFLASKIDWQNKTKPEKTVLFNYYKKLIALRKTNPAFKIHDRNSMEVISDNDNNLISVLRTDSENRALLLAIMNYAETDQEYVIQQGEKWKLYLDSADVCWQGNKKNNLSEIKKEEKVVLKARSIIIFQNT